MISYFLTVKKDITCLILQLNYIDGFSSNLIYKNKNFKKPKFNSQLNNENKSN